MTRKSMHVTVIIMFSLALMALCFACSSKDPKPEKPGNVIKSELEGAPDWVAKGCQLYFKGKDDPKICGVGSAGGSRNVSLMRTTAISRARAEIATNLSTQVKRMQKDYQSNTTGGENFGTSASDEQHIADIGKQVTDMSLSGTEMIDSWVSNTGTFWVLVTMDTEKFKDSINKMKNLSEGLRKAIVERAEKEFGDLDKEIDKEREAKQ